MVNSKQISIVVHGEIRNSLINLFKFLKLNFRESEIIHVIYDTQESYVDYNNELSTKKIIIKEPIESYEFGWHTRNFNRHVSSAYEGIKVASQDYIIKIRCDIVPNYIETIKIREDDLIQRKFFNYYFETNKIYVYPYYVTNTSYFFGDMIVYGLRKNLELLFDPSRHISLNELSTLRAPIASHKITYVTPEELLYMSYVRSLLGNTFDPNDLVCNDDIFICKEFILKLNCNVQLPVKIKKYFSSCRGIIFYLLMRNKIYTKIKRIFN